jgi:protein-L-isoaspartate O-methyltransferase
MPDPAYDSFCYLNDYVPFSDGSCLSAPGLVALMIERLQVQSGQRILEVGCGSGFHAAWISELVDNDCTIVGAEINEDYGLLGRMALHRAGYSNIDLRLGDAEIVLDTDERFDRIYLTAANQSGMPTFLETFLRDDGIIQYVRGINREEFESQPNDTWLPQTFGDFKGYISGDWRRFCCIATARKTCDGMVEIDRLFDVSFVPFVNHRQPNSAKPRDPFIELQPFLPLHISEC